MSRYVASHLISKLILSAMICSPLMVSVALADDSGLSREDIMRHHRQLEQQYQSGGSGAAVPTVSTASPVNDSAAPSRHDVAPLAAPLSASSGGGTSLSGSHGSNLVAQLLERVNELEGQVREMRGEVDQLTNQLHQDEAATNKKMSDMQFALQGDSGHTASNSGNTRSVSKGEGASPGASAPAPSSVPSAKQSLQLGKAALKAHHYSEAEQQARSALQTAHSAQGKTDAQFLLAQSLAGQKSYRQAAVAYYDVYSHNPHSERAPEALLGVSGSMLALGSKEAACEALGRLKREFPDASSRVKASEKVFRERASCH